MEFCSEGLHPLRDLTSLTIQLQELSRITDQSTQFLCSQTLRYLPKMASLSLQLGWCEQMTDHAIEILASSGLRKLPLLKILHLGFQDWKKMTEKVLKVLGTFIPFQVMNLSLDFGDCKEIGDVGLRDLMVLDPTNLKTLNLRFPMTKVTYEGLAILIYRGLAEMKKLKGLELNFENCQGISDKGMSILCGEGLRKLKDWKNYH